ncbi:4-fold beta flower protein [Vibrio splendidus]|uniref:4-fold beta flower protein n=1 Tax=Vibrio TaxID=662 RepID=UPI000D3B6919|nr:MULTISPECIES: hypothetical protein [Vibrio]MBB1465422.1 hypothetical protein [Vibrio sp. SG41-7]PTO98999.1 hypothetical protein CWN88_19085 [Vibrio splendidus]
MKLLSLVFFSFISFSVFAEDEVSLFSGSGDASAYIALSDEMTIYLWSGKPVAYLSTDDNGGYHVYGFNGKHLGWFINGVVRDHQGNAACATKELMKSTKFEPFKSFKEFKPFKAFQEFSPSRPGFSSSFGQTSCKFLMASGGTN